MMQETAFDVSKREIEILDLNLSPSNDNEWKATKPLLRPTLFVLRHQCFYARGKVSGLEKLKPSKGLQGVGH